MKSVRCERVRVLPTRLFSFIYLCLMLTPLFSRYSSGDAITIIIADTPIYRDDAAAGERYGDVYDADAR